MAKSREERMAEHEARKQRWARPVQQEGIETVGAEPEPDETTPPEPAPVMPPVEDGEGGYGVSAPEPLVLAEERPELPTEATAFDIYMASLSDETRELLSVEELRGAFEAAEREAAEEKRKRLRKAAAERALHQARASAGLLPQEKLDQLAWQDRMNRKVRFTVQLPFISDTGSIGDEGLRIDGRLLQHGQEVEMTYGEYLSVREMIWRLRQHELDFEGKGRLHHLRRMVEARGYDVNGVRQ